MMLLHNKQGFCFEIGLPQVICQDDEFLIVSVKNHSTIGLSKRYWINDKNISDYISFIHSNNIANLFIVLDDPSFLESCPDIRKVLFFPADESTVPGSFDPLYRLKHLQMLEVSTQYGFKERLWSSFDCSKLSSSDCIEDFAGNVRNTYHICALSNLKSLRISHYTGSDLVNIIGSNAIDTLQLVLCGSLTSLHGLSYSKKMEVMSIVKCSKLTNIDELYDVRDTLKGLSIDSCNKITSFSILCTLTNLTFLRLWGNNTLPSLDFLRMMPNLQTLILGMNVADGDLSPCDRIRHVSVFPNRRHYNRRNTDFCQFNYSTCVNGDEDIEPWRQCVLSPASKEHFSHVNKLKEYGWITDPLSVSD